MQTESRNENPIWYICTISGDDAHIKWLDAEKRTVDRLREIATHLYPGSRHWHIYKRTKDLLFESRGVSPDLEFILTDSAIENHNCISGTYTLIDEFES